YPDSLPYIERPVGPKQTDQFHLSLRFGANDATLASLAADIQKRSVATSPSTKSWYDRLWFRTVAARAGVDVTFGPEGLGSLKYREEELLGSGTFRVDRVVMKGDTGTAFDADLTSTIRTDTNRKEVTRQYKWGSVAVQYAPVGDRLNLTITTTNTSPSIIQSVFYEPFALKFPAKPKEYDGNTPLLGHNIGSPTVLPLSYSSGVVALVNEDMKRPLMIGFPWALDRPASTLFPVKVNTGRNDMYPDSMPNVNRPVGPGQSDQFHLSLRFGPEDATAASLAGDAWKRFGAAFPPRLDWTDRRPIGTLFLATAGEGWRTNPRGWFHDPQLDVISKSGRNEFRLKLNAFIDESIAVLRDMNAQGMILWDIEGEEFNHAITYIGDPRLVSTLAPEMDELADQFFARYRDAGFRVGVCVRPQVFTRVSGNTIEQRESADPARVLIDKIAYARKRWDATLFYIDSNGTPNFPMDPDVFRKVLEQFPDVLLVPEHANLRYYAYSAPLRDLRRSPAPTTDEVRSIYPNAFSLINTADGPIDKHYEELVGAVSRGDVLVYRSWYRDPENAKLKTIYGAAQASVKPIFRQPFTAANLVAGANALP
ncbi:MAG: hypothetical protein ACRD7E_00480, partial [Bryobacteraceae bacterium]